MLHNFTFMLVTCFASETVSHCMYACVLLFCRSWFLVPYVHIVVWYFAFDSVAMFWSFRQMRGPERELGWRRQMGPFLKKKWSFLLHHVLVFTFAYPMIVVSCEKFWSQVM